MTFSESSKFGQAAIMKDILKRCSSLRRKQTGCVNEGLSLDVRKDHFVVYVCERRHRYVVPIRFLTNPEFQNLLEKAAEEFGFHHCLGLTIPRNEVFLFCHSLRRLDNDDCGGEEEEEEDNSKVD